MCLKVGDSTSLKRRLTFDIIKAYGEISGDMNLLHFSDEYAMTLGFQGCIAHGLFCLGMVSNLIGNTLPGPGSIFLDEELKYQNPVYIGDEIEAKVSISSIDEKGIIEVSFVCTNQRGMIVLKGKTKVLNKTRTILL